MNKTSKTYKAISQVKQQVLTGTMLAIDPSTGSQSSMPGYALFVEGKMVESGEILVDKSLNRSKRLYEISRTIREELPHYDILAVEYIPPVVYGGRKSMNKNGLMALQKAIGAILAAYPVEILLEIPASFWKQFKPEDYVKTDEMDAISIGLAVVNTAKYQTSEE